VFALQFTFEPEYPISSPEVVFVADNGYQTPIHPHVYSNGHVSVYRMLALNIQCQQICASILGHEWSPVLSVASVCITLQSMLASCKV
jgi:ubiquitin-conjugating enzyme E2 W